MRRPTFLQEDRNFYKERRIKNQTDKINLTNLMMPRKEQYSLTEQITDSIKQGLSTLGNICYTILPC